MFFELQKLTAQQGRVVSNRTQRDFNASFYASWDGGGG